MNESDKIVMNVIYKRWKKQGSETKTIEEWQRWEDDKQRTEKITYDEYQRQKFPKPPYI